MTLGVRVLARSKPQRELLEGTVRPALALLDWPDRAKAESKNILFKQTAATVGR